jgi:hypothetical protein
MFGSLRCSSDRERETTSGPTRSFVRACCVQPGGWRRPEEMGRQVGSRWMAPAWGKPGRTQPSDRVSPPS